MIWLTYLNLLQCFCESRKVQAFYTSCLENAITKEEKEFLMKLAETATKTSNEIKEFCELIHRLEE